MTSLTHFRASTLDRARPAIAYGSAAWIAGLLLSAAVDTASSGQLVVLNILFVRLPLSFVVLGLALFTYRFGSRLPFYVIPVLWGLVGGGPVLLELVPVLAGQAPLAYSFALTGLLLLTSGLFLPWSGRQSGLFGAVAITTFAAGQLWKLDAMAESFSRESLELFAVQTAGLAVCALIIAGWARLSTRLRLRVFQLSEQLRLAEADAKRVTLHDPLTSLPNRTYFMAEMNKQTHRSRRSKSKFALLFINLDGFKDINDKYGSDAGDYVLQEVAARLETGLRQSDFVGRHGGDEFLALLPDMPEKNQSNSLQIVIDKINEQLAESVRLGTDYIPLSATIGVAIFPDEGNHATSIIRKADSDMRAKKRAR